MAEALKSPDQARQDEKASSLEKVKAEILIRRQNVNALKNMVWLAARMEKTGRTIQSALKKIFNK